MQEPVHLSRECACLGEWMASCGPKDTTPGTLYHITGVVSPIIGIVLLMLPMCVRPATPEDAAFARLFFGCFGGFMILVGISMFVIPLFSVPVEIHLFAKGLVARVRDKDRIIPWDSIEQVKFFEWYDNRWSPRTVNVVVKIRGQKTLKFNSGLQGDSDRIIDQISEDVENTEFVPFQA